MAAIALRELLPVLQTAIGPVILISGIGLLLLSMTNRYGRVIDRARELVRRLAALAAAGGGGEGSGGGGERDRLVAEIEVLYRRARILRDCILLTTFSLLLVAVLMVVVFLSVLFAWEDGTVVGLLFVAAIAALVGGLVLFLKDLQVSLRALGMEVAASCGSAAGGGVRR